MNDRENMDLLWALVQACQSVGWHSAKLHEQPIIEKFSDAYQQQVELMSKVFLKMEFNNFTEQDFDEVMKKRG
jgi:hypothetical protein